MRDISQDTGRGCLMYRLRIRDVCEENTGCSSSFVHRIHCVCKGYRTCLHIMHDVYPFSTVCTGYRMEMQCNGD